MTWDNSNKAIKLIKKDCSNGINFYSLILATMTFDQSDIFIIFMFCPSRFFYKITALSNNNSN